MAKYKTVHLLLEHLLRASWRALHQEVGCATFDKKRHFGSLFCGATLCFVHVPLLRATSGNKNKKEMIKKGLERCSCPRRPEESSSSTLTVPVLNLSVKVSQIVSRLFVKRLPFSFLSFGCFIQANRSRLQLEFILATFNNQPNGLNCPFV